MVNRPFSKLTYKYLGPYTVEGRIGLAAYKLKIPEGSLIHLMFYISQLRQHILDHTPSFSTIPVTIDSSVADTIPEAIVNRRLVKKGNSSHLMVLIKWSKLPHSFITWEDDEVVKKRYPGAPAWGQVGFDGEGDVVAMLGAKSMLPLTRMKTSKKKEELRLTFSNYRGSSTLVPQL